MFCNEQKKKKIESGELLKVKINIFIETIDKLLHLDKCSLGQQTVCISF
jgi:hypothetical protein